MQTAWTSHGPRTRTDLKALQQRAHIVFDRRWNRVKGNEGRRVKRLKEYAWLAGRLGIPEGDCHFGRFSVARLEEVVRICEAEEAK